MYEAYCDACFTPCSIEDAKLQKPCAQCGNVHFCIPTVSRLGDSILMRSTRRRNMDAYFDALTEMDEIHVTGISENELERLYAAGERCIAVLGQAVREMREEYANLCGNDWMPSAFPAVTRLPEMYMRYGRWDDARRVYALSCEVPELHSIYDFDKLRNELDARQSCTAAIVAILSSGEHSQKRIKTTLPSFTRDTVNWCLRFYSGFVREKRGGDYDVRMAH